MAKLQKGTTFVDGNSYNAAALNNLVDAAIILPGAITEQTAGSTPAVGDQFLFNSISAAALRQCTLQDIINGLPVDGAVGTGTLRTLGTGAQQGAPGNDSRFPSSVTGLRLGAGAGGLDAAANANDIDPASVNLGGGLNINWAAGGLFYDTLPSGSGTRTYTFSNVKAGSSRTIVFGNGSFTGTIAWPSLLGTVPAYTSAGGYNVYTFFCWSGGSIAGVVKNL